MTNSPEGHRIGAPPPDPNARTGSLPFSPVSTARKAAPQTPQLTEAPSAAGLLDEFESLYDKRVIAVATLMDEHQWLPSHGRCACGHALAVDWWMWRAHVTPLIALGQSDTEQPKEPKAKPQQLNTPPTKPRNTTMTTEVNNPDELAALPKMSVVQFRGPGLGEKTRLVWQYDDEWYSPGDTESHPSHYFPPAAFPAAVLWTPA
ncbi:hypothetical protein [Mycolicibacterium llatzerense]|uniref:hypothetical protein n=1 Tax=Mycolicibacterium llatzerense TaxID=280871 RepID=UPI0021B636CC|nr:hypothetical protein [Mycolicibacterium llatzerense]